MNERSGVALLVAISLVAMIGLCLPSSGEACGERCDPPCEEPCECPTCEAEGADCCAEIVAALEKLESPRIEELLIVLVLAGIMLVMMGRDR